MTLAILTRNRPDCLELALAAAVGGEDVPDDLLVSDDSDDALRGATAEVVARFPCVRYVTGPRRGLGANENHIVANLLPAAQWIVFNGDDARLSSDFVAILKRLLSHHAPHRRIPTGSELRCGAWIRPHGLDFLGYQSVLYPDYAPGAPVETIVVQATALPAVVLRELSWLEVSAYGYDEVDMAAKFRRLGWEFVYEPSLWLHHDQSPVGRDAYPEPTQIARLYFRLRSFSVYERRLLHLLAFMVIAPLHLVAAQARRSAWRGVRDVPRITLTAYAAWLRSLRTDWRHS